MSDPQNLGSSSPGAFNQPTQPAVKSLTPAVSAPPTAQSTVPGNAVPDAPGKSASLGSSTQQAAPGLGAGGASGMGNSMGGGSSGGTATPRFFFTAVFSGTSDQASIDYSSIGLSAAPSRVLASIAITNSLLGIDVQVIASSITAVGCTIQSNDPTWVGTVSVEVVQ